MATREIWGMLGATYTIDWGKPGLEDLIRHDFLKERRGDRVMQLGGTTLARRFFLTLDLHVCSLSLSTKKG